MRQIPTKRERTVKVGLMGHLNLKEADKLAFSQVTDCAVQAVTHATVMVSRAANLYYLKLLEEREGLFPRQEEERRDLEVNHAIEWQRLLELHEGQLIQHQNRQHQDRQVAEHFGLDQDQWQQQHHLEDATLIGNLRTQQLQLSEVHENQLVFLLDEHYQQQVIPPPDQGFYSKLFKQLNPAGRGEGEPWAREALLNIYEVDNFEQVPKVNDRVGDKTVALSRIFEYAARGMATNTWNHVKENYYDHFKSAVRMVATRIRPSFNEGRKNKKKLNSVVYFGASWMIEAEHGVPLIGEADALALLLEKQGGLIDDDLAGNETKQAVSRGVWQYVVESVRSYGGVVNVYNRLGRKDFHNLMPWLYKINCEIGCHNDSIRHDPANADYFAGFVHGLYPQLKFENNFTMVPLGNLEKAQYIQIDEKTAYSLIKDIVALPQNGAYYGTHTGELWGMILNLTDIRKKRLRLGQQHWKFSGCIKTDGVSLDVHYCREMTDDEIADARDQQRVRVSRTRLEVTPRDQWPERQHFEDHQVVGVDPGTNLTCAGADEVAPEGQDNRPRHPSKTFQPPQPPSRKSNACNKKKKWPRKSRNGNRRKQLRGGRKKQRGRRREKVYQCSNDCFRHETGSKEAQSNSIKRLQSTHVFYEGYNGIRFQTTLYDVKVNTPTAKVVTSQQFLPHCRHVRKFLDNIVDDLMVRKVRRARFDRYMKRQAALNKVCNGITFGMNDAIVVFGNCTGQKKHFPFPTKEIVRHLQHYKGTKVIIFDEFRTSKCCSKCAFNQELGERRGDKMDGENTKRGKKKGCFPIYGVRVCKNCGTRWHRDINAARSMRLIFLHMVENQAEVRPFPFARP